MTVFVDTIVYIGHFHRAKIEVFHCIVFASPVSIVFSHSGWVSAWRWCWSASGEGKDGGGPGWNFNGGGQRSTSSDTVALKLRLQGCYRTPQCVYLCFVSAQLRNLFEHFEAHTCQLRGEAGDVPCNGLNLMLQRREVASEVGQRLVASIYLLF